MAWKLFHAYDCETTWSLLVSYSYITILRILTDVSDMSILGVLPCSLANQYSTPYILQ